MTVGVAVRSTPAGGGRPTWLGHLAEIVACTWAHAYPGGPAEMSATLALDSKRMPSALTAGRRLEVYRGCELVWAGLLDEPDRSNGWTITGKGLAGLANDHQLRQYQAWLSPHVADAIANGLPWETPDVSLPTLAAAPDKTLTLAGVLAEAEKQLGLLWRVDVAGRLTFTVPPAAPTRLVRASAPPGGRPRGPTVLIGQYKTSDTATVSGFQVYESPQVNRYRLDQAVDLTSMGVISAATCLATLATLWATRYATAPWTQPITVARGQVTTLNGGVIDPLRLQAGWCGRFAGVNPDTELLDASPDVVIGRVACDAAAGTAELTPLQVDQSDLISTLARVA